MTFHFAVPEVSAELHEFRLGVRRFLQQSQSTGQFSPATNCWLNYSPAFSRQCGEAGYIGMTWPARYGGHERSARERFVMAEEMLAAGAPVGAHWIADRQSGTLILRTGSERLKSEILPRIAAGTCYFAIGMSEPDTGSDLASVRTRAVRDQDGWRVHGRKVWTTNADKAHYLIALVRTAPAEGNERHVGLTQMVVDLAQDGVEIRPINNIAGKHEFNEVVFDGCFVPDHCVVGEVGGGWKGVTSELALERSGPDRFLSLAVFVRRIFAVAGQNDAPPIRRELGRLLSHLMTLHNMSLAVCAMAESGHSPNTEAALVKDLGTTFEQEIPEIGRRVLSYLPDGPELVEVRQNLAEALMEAPSFSLRGGTREVLRGIIARELRLR